MRAAAFVAGFLAWDDEDALCAAILAFRRRLRPEAATVNARVLSDDFVAALAV
jgi:hypothetical protein